MNREPINPDDPQLTAYALGEMSAAESAEFEARLRQSPTARRELAGMSEIMGLLSEGLRNEWSAEVSKPTLQLLEPAKVETAVPADNVVVAANFSRPRRTLGTIAAGLAAVLAIGAIAAVKNQAGAPQEVAAASESATQGISVGLIAAADGIHVPKLFLAEEVEDVSSLDLADATDDSELASRIDASYLEAESVVPVSYKPVSDRVDSYLPPVAFENPAGGMKSSMIEKRLRDRFIEVDGSHASEDPTSVVVRGFVTMGEESTESSGPGRVLAGFRPVAVSGNLVVDGESDLRVLADLNRLNQELSEVVSELPENSVQRRQLESILERSKQTTGELRGIFAR